MGVGREMFILYYILFLVIAIFERLSSTFNKNCNFNSGKIYNKWSFYAPLFTYITIVAASISEFFFKSGRINFSVTMMGLAVYVIGVFIRRKAVSDLSENWSVFIEIKKNQRLVKDGIYRVFKHPYCLAVMLELCGVCLIANSYLSLMLVFFIQLPLLLARISLEEHVLSVHFGGAYRVYCAGKFF